MTENRPFAAWLRSLAGLVALAGVLGTGRLRRRQRGAEQRVQHTGTR